MRVIFVALGMEQLAIGQLGAILRREGHQVGLAFSRHLFDDRYFLRMPKLAKLFDDDDVVEQVTRFRPDVVCFSALTVNYRWMADVARRVKDACGAVTVFGGVHPSAVPEVVLEEEAIDYVCIGEGDVALPQLLIELRGGPVSRPLPNIAFRGPDGAIVRGPQLGFYQDLDSLPGFEKDLWLDHVRVDSWYLTMSSRGCPYRCTFCFNNFFAKLGGSDRQKAGKYVRQRSVDHFLGELREAKRRYGIQLVDIQDDIFTVDIEWLREFAPRYRKEIGVPFACLSHPHFIDAEKVRLLKEAGCVWVQMGIQSVDEEYRHQIKRYEKQHRIEQAIELFERAGIQLKTDHMFGLPGEAPEAQQKALELYRQHDLGRIGTYWLCYTPGTEIVEAGMREGLVTESEMTEVNHGHSTFFYRDQNVVDLSKRKKYLAFEAVFRTLPLLPPTLRSRMRVEHLDWMPAPVVKLFGHATDLLVGIQRDNPNLKGYWAQYLHGFQNHLRQKLGLPLHRVADPEYGNDAQDARPVPDAPPDGPRATSVEAPAPPSNEAPAGRTDVPHESAARGTAEAGRGVSRRQRLPVLIG